MLGPAPASFADVGGAVVVIPHRRGHDPALLDFRNLDLVALLLLRLDRYGAFAFLGHDGLLVMPGWCEREDSRPHRTELCLGFLRFVSAIGQELVDRGRGCDRCELFCLSLAASLAQEVREVLFVEQGDQISQTHCLLSFLGLRGLVLSHGALLVVSCFSI